MTVLPGALQALLAFSDERPQVKIWAECAGYADMTMNASSCVGEQTLCSSFTMKFPPPFLMRAERIDRRRGARDLGARFDVTPEANIIHRSGAAAPAQATRNMPRFNATIAPTGKRWNGAVRALGRQPYLLRLPVRRFGRGVTVLLSGRRNRMQGAAKWRENWYRRGCWLTGHAGGACKT